MKEISSDFLYYKSLVGLIIGTILIAAFIGFFWKDDFSGGFVIFSYIILFVFTLIQWIRWSHQRKVYYDGNSLILKRYFSDQSQTISISDITDVKFVYNFSVNKERELIEVFFKSNGKYSYISFFKNSDKTTLNKLLGQINAKE